MPTISSKEIRKLLDLVERTPGFRVEYRTRQQRAGVFGPDPETPPVWVKIGASGHSANAATRLLRAINWPPQEGVLQLPPPSDTNTHEVVVNWEKEELASYLGVNPEDLDTFAPSVEDEAIPHELNGAGYCRIDCPHPSHRSEAPEPQEPEPVTPTCDDEQDPSRKEEPTMTTCRPIPNPPPLNPGQAFRDAMLEYLQERPNQPFTLEQIVDAIGTHGLKRASVTATVSTAFLYAVEGDLWLCVHRSQHQRPIRYWWDDETLRAPTNRALRNQLDEELDLVGGLAEVLAPLPDSGELLMRMEDGSIWVASPLRR